MVVRTPSGNPDAADERRNDELEALYAEALNLPGVPASVHDFGGRIEDVKLMLGRLGDVTGELREHASLIRSRHAEEVKADKAYTNDVQRKKAVADRCAGDSELQMTEARLANFTEAWRRWDARRSRLNRAFEVAKIDYQANRTMDAAEVSSRYLQDAVARLETGAKGAAEAFLSELRQKLFNAADYFVNKLRGAL